MRITNAPDKDLLLSGADLERWLGRELGLSGEMSVAVAAELSATFGADPVPAHRFLTAAGRYAVGLTRGLSPQLRPSVLPNLLPDPATALSTIVEILGGTLEKGGWKFDGPDVGWKKEFGGAILFFDDANAPSFGLCKKISEGCCDGARGVKLGIKVKVSDDSGLPGNDSGVRKIVVKVVDPVHPDIVSDDGAVEVELGDDKNDQSQAGPVDVDVEICVPCSFISGGRAILSIRAVDDDDNARYILRSYDVSETAARCCSRDQGNQNSGHSSQ